MGEPSKDDMEYLLRNVTSELNSMNASKKRIVTRSEQSFGHWASNTITQVARGLGYIIALPFRIVGEVVSALWRALFG